MSDNANVGKVFNLTGGNGGNGSLTLEGLSVTKVPNKTTYKSGEAFDPTGMVVTALYAYGLTSDVTGYTVSPTILTDGISEVTITYTEGRVTKTTSTPVTVEKVLESIEVTTPPTKTNYNYLESFDPTGMVVTAHFSDGSTAQAAGYTYSSTAFSTLGSQQITIGYTYEDVSKETTLSVTVSAISVPIPTQKNTPTYDGTSKTPEWNNYDSTKMEMTGDTSGLNAKTNYTVTFTLAYGYVFPDGTNEAVVTWTINRAVIDAVPEQTDIPAADGTVKSPSWSGYDPTKMTIGGDQYGTAAGDYTATFTPTSNYQWWDGTTAAKSVTWTIASVIVAIPSQVNIPTYDGTSKTPEWDSYDSEHCTVSVTAQTDAGEYEAVFTLLSGMWSDGTTGTKTVKWTIGRATIDTVPAQSGTLVYDGNPHTPTLDANYSSAKMTLAVEAKTNAGEYTATVTPTSNYQWSDGTTGAKTITWTIGKATPVVTAPKANSLTYTGSEQALVTAGSTTGGTLQYSTDGSNYSSTIPTGKAAGSYKVYYRVAGDTNYNDVTAASVSVTIAKATGTMTGVPTSITLDSDTKTYDFTIAGNFDGSFTVASDDTSVATVALVSGKTYRVSSVNDTTGTAVITVTPSGGTNYTVPSAQTIAVTAQFVTIYGVEWDWTSSGPTNGTRTDAAASFSDPSPAVSSGTGSSPFDNLYPWCDMVKETRTGGVMVKEPKYYFKWTKTGKKLKLQIADGYVEGFHVDPVNMDRGDGLGELDYSYIARYHCASSTYKSTTGVAQQVSITRSTARSKIHALGDNIWQMDFAQMWYVGMLFLVEFADWNGEKIGRGCSSSGSKANNGQTDSMTYHTGTTASSRDSYGFTQYRNIEGWWDNVFDWMDGCYYTSSGLNVILNPSSFSDSANGTLVGLPVAGYPSDFTIPTTSGFEWALFPSEANGSTTTYVPDYWSFNGSYPCLLHGGSCGQNQYYGPFCVYCYSTSSAYTNIGCRLQERPPKAA